MRKVLRIERKFERCIRLNVSMKMSECEKIGELSPMMSKGNETRVSLLAVLITGCVRRVLRVAVYPRFTQNWFRLLACAVTGQNSITKLPAAGGRPLTLSPDMHTGVLSEISVSHKFPPSRRNF
jgi:hypothetical protein